MYKLLKVGEKQRVQDEEINRLKFDRAIEEHLKSWEKKEKHSEHLPKEKVECDLNINIRFLPDQASSRIDKRCDDFSEKEPEYTPLKNKSKLKTVRDEKLRQLLWETSPELRDLRQKVLLAEVARDQTMQMAEKQALQDLVKKETQVYAEENLRAKEQMEEEANEKELQDMRAKLKYHKELSELIDYKKAQEGGDEEEHERERAAIDDIRKQIEEEDRLKSREKLEKKRELDRQAKELLRVRNEMRLEQKLKEAAEETKVDEYRHAQKLRAKELEEKKQMSAEQRLQLQEDLLFELERMCSEKLRREILRTELAIEEREWAERGKDEEAESRKMRIRAELQRVYQMQIQVKKRKEDLQKKEEALYHEKLMSDLYEEDKLELLSREKRQLKKLEHRRIAQAMIEQNRIKKMLEQARETADQKYQDELESERLKMVNEEKVRFLKEHSPDLLAYLPKEILQGEQLFDAKLNKY